jgi:hypothetical protein
LPDSILKSKKAKDGCLYGFTDGLLPLQQNHKIMNYIYIYYFNKRSTIEQHSWPDHIREGGHIKHIRVHTTMSTHNIIF